MIVEAPVSGHGAGSTPQGKPPFFYGGLVEEQRQKETLATCINFHDELSQPKNGPALRLCASSFLLSHSFFFMTPSALLINLFVFALRVSVHEWREGQ